MTSVIVESLSFSHSGAVPLFDAACFVLQHGFVGIVGESGSGKTTLLELLAGHRMPAAGRIRRVPQGARVVLASQRVDRADAAIRSFAESATRDAFRLRSSLGLSVEQVLRWSSLSPGERKRWQVGAALFAEPEVLLLDEPTNHLDAEARDWLVRALRGFAGVGAIVSHDRTFLDALSTHTLRVSGGRVENYPGPYSIARVQWQREAEERQRSRRLAQQEVSTRNASLEAARHQRAAADRRRSSRARMKSPKDRDARSAGAKFRAARAEASLARAVAREQHGVARAQAALQSVVTERELGRSVFVRYQPAPRRVLVELRCDEIRTGERVLLRDLELSVGRVDRIHIAGPNGSGKTTLLRGLLESASLDPARVLHLPQHPGPEQELRWLAELRALAREEKGRTLSILAALGLEPERALTTERPSPGEARKLALALAMGRHAWLLCLDEPSNHLDLPSVERLERALLEFPGAILLVTHDEPLARRITTTTWELSGGRVNLR